jgi:hypothetical protein
MSDLEKIGEMIGETLRAKQSPVTLEIGKIETDIEAKPLADAIELSGKRNAAALESALLIVADSLGRSVADGLSSIPEPKSNEEIAKRLAELVEGSSNDDLLKAIGLVASELSLGVKATRLLSTEFAKNTAAIEANTQAILADRVFSYDDEKKVKRVKVVFK